MTGPADIITTTLGGRTFRCYRRDEAHLLWTIERLAVDYPSAELVIVQPCFNVGVAASAGTHDKGSVFDFYIDGVGWEDAQTWLRKHGWAAWYRYPPLFGYHLHAVSLGYPGEVGIYVPGQVADYYAHRSGLSGHVADNTWHPADIDSTIFDYPAWVAGQEDRDMANYADQLNEIQAQGQANAKAIAEVAAEVVNLSDRFEVVRKNTLGRDQALAKQLRKVGLTEAQILAVLEDKP